MALSTQEEQVVKEIIEAYKNGKRLSDLPDVSGTNPYNLYCEVLDEDGESKKAALASLIPYKESECSYGIEFDTSVSTPICTRIGNIELHKTLPIQERMKGCLLADNGKVVEYLDPNDWTGHTRDGSRGQVMVEIPMHYRKCETDGTKRRVRISELPLPGYHQVPKIYVSAYEATVQRTGNKLSSVVNDSADFRGGNNNPDWDGTYRSLLGRPATQISRTNFRNFARNRKAGSTEWNCMTYEAQKTIYWLFAVEYATLNTQAEYNPKLTVEGLRQGGLGAGVVFMGSDKWSAFNNFYPFIPCGFTDSLGNRTGIRPFTMPHEYNPDTDSPVVTNVPRYRGIENKFGHIWSCTDGINVRVSPTFENGGDNLSKVFVCNDPSRFNDTNYEGYRHVGNVSRDEGFVKEFILSEFGEIVPVLTGGGSTTYFCDYYYANIPTTETLRIIILGGNAGNGAHAGLACMASTTTPSNTHAYIGSRLCFIPFSAA